MRKNEHREILKGLVAGKVKVAELQGKIEEMEDKEMTAVIGDDEHPYYLNDKPVSREELQAEYDRQRKRYGFIPIMMEMVE